MLNLVEKLFKAPWLMRGAAFWGFQWVWKAWVEFWGIIKHVLAMGVIFGFRGTEYETKAFLACLAGVIVWDMVFEKGQSLIRSVVVPTAMLTSLFAFLAGSDPSAQGELALASLCMAGALGIGGYSAGNGGIIGFVLAVAAAGVGFFIPGFIASYSIF